MSDRIQNIVITGLGGQGVLKASDMLAYAAFLHGYDVKKAEVHGMSQRGGAVTSDVRFGDLVLSPMAPPGEADYLVVLDTAQIEPTRHRLKPDGCLLACDLVDPTSLPTPIALNVAMLGALSVLIEIPAERYRRAIYDCLPARLHAINRAAFAVGRMIGKRRTISH